MDVNNLPLSRESNTLTTGDPELSNVLCVTSSNHILLGLLLAY